jgi:hypothetical protein
MMRLTTKYIAHEDNSHLVAWTTGLKNNGFVRVISTGEPDQPAIAELIAFRYLLFSENVFDREIISGKGYEYRFSTPVIKKVLNRKSTKDHIARWASFIPTHLDGLIFKQITPHEEQFLPALGCRHDVIEINPQQLDDIGFFDTPALGKLRITAHAIDQYVKRHDCGDLNNPKSSLIRRLRHPGLKQMTLPEEVMNHKHRKYGRIDVTEFWGHPDGNIFFTVLRSESGIGTVITTWHRSRAYVAD